MIGPPSWPAWARHDREGTADELHALDLPLDHAGSGPAVWRLEVRRPALVLGSTQSVDDVDIALADRLGIEVVGRRSGGGAVVLVPGEVVWCDLVVPAGDASQAVDVGEQFGAAGERWRAALAAGGLDAGRLSVLPAATRPGPRGRVVCFGGLGPGEVVLAGEPATKLVGLSQRRTRAGVRVQGLVHRRFDAEQTARLVAPGLRRIGLDPGTVADELARAVAAVDVDAAAVAAALADPPAPPPG